MEKETKCVLDVMKKEIEGKDKKIYTVMYCISVILALVIMVIIAVIAIIKIHSEGNLHTIYIPILSLFASQIISTICIVLHNLSVKRDEKLKCIEMLENIDDEEIKIEVVKKIFNL